MKRLSTTVLLALLITSPASAVTLATDDFNRADADPIGGNWTTIPMLPALKIAGNTAQASLTNNTSGAYYNAVSAPDDQWSQVTIAAMVAGIAPCAVVRIDASDQSYYAACPHSGFLEVHKRIAGVKTDLSALVINWPLSGQPRLLRHVTARKQGAEPEELTPPS